MFTPTSLRHNAHIPFASGIIERPRLLEKLQGALDHKLTLISAPPGYGKTTLAAQFARESPFLAAWHAVEERERDVPNLHSQAVTALSYIAPGIETLVPSPGYTAAELASLVTNYLRDNVSETILYVIDDVHQLSGSNAAETWLRTFTALIPPNCHLILISRALPDLPLTEMIARREVLAIGQDQLRFTADEVRRLADKLEVMPSQDQVHALASSLEGWPAGTVLALQPLPVELERFMLQGGQGPEALFDSLAAVTLDAQPPGLRDFLLGSSTLTRLTPELCSMALGLPDSADWLNEAINRNLFISKVSGGLVYHRLFRDFLQQTLYALDSARYVGLHCRAAQWFEAHNRIDDAFEHYVAAGLTDEAAAIAEHNSRTYFAQGKVETLLGWVSRLKRVGVQPPHLLYTAAMIHTDRYEYELAEEELALAEESFLMRRDAVGSAEVQVQRSMINVQRGRYAEAVAQAGHLATDQSYASSVRGRALKVLGFARLHLGQVGMATRDLEEAVALFRSNGDAYSLAGLLQDLEVAYIRSGRLNDAAACLQEVVALRRSLGSAGALALALNNLGYHYHQRGDYRQALLTFQEGLSVVARVLDKRAEGYLLWSLGDLHRDLGAVDEALRCYHKVLELIRSSEPYLRSATLVSMSVLHRWHGKLRDSITLADEAAQIANKHEIAFESAVANAARWASLAHMGETEQALLQLDMLAEHLRQQHNQLGVIQVFGLCALVATVQEDAILADRYLKQAVRLAQESGGGGMQILAAEVVHSPLLQDLVDRSPSSYGNLSHDLKRLRDARHQPPAPNKTRAQLTPEVTYSLRILSLGRETVERDGVPVVTSEWRANSAQELFLYLLFEGPQTRENISLEFWPESSAKRVRSNFHTTLYRARHALGENVILFEDEIYQINPDLDLWCDAQEFESLTRQASFLSPRDARTEDLWRRAVELYRGDFLPSFEADWIVARRERLNEAYLEALIGLGQCARARGAFKTALTSFKRALEVDPYREDIHRDVLHCYADLGDKNQVLAHLKKLRDLFRQDLSVEPSSETLALARTLLR